MGVMRELRPRERSAVPAAESWFSFWSRPPRVHVSERHLQARYRAVVREFLNAFPEVQGKRLLDYGCGEALGTPTLLSAGLELLLYDRSDWFRERVEQRFAGNQRLAILDTVSLASLPSGSVDYILVCSVIQYLNHAELGALLDLSHRLLRPGGTLVLADIIPRQLDTMADTLDFLNYSARHRFLFSGLRTLLDMVASDYAHHLRQHHLTRYDLAGLGDLLAMHGFRQPHVLPRNIGISRARKTMAAVRPG